jgi:hypothetical protein
MHQASASGATVEAEVSIDDLEPIDGLNEMRV